MTKLLLLIGLGLALYFLLRAPRVRSESPQAPRTGAGPSPGPALPQPMVRCAVCSVHLPQAEALSGASGRLYCSHEHRIQGGN